VAKGPVKPIESRISFHGHPIHPTLVHFPVALLLSAVLSDAAFIYTGDYFWARGSIWLIGIGALGGWVAGLVGLIELLLTRPIRHLITGWNHGILAVMMLSLASFNWMIRLEDIVLLLNPWGLYMSLLTAAMILVTSVHGGHLVYEHAVGVNVD
jgi:uncharacterized membrane protein